MVRYPQYSKYKATSCPWLKEVPEHWSFKRLKNVATHNDEALDERTDPDFEMEYVDISSVSLTNGIENSETLKFEKAPSRARRKVKNGDIIVSTVRTYLKAIAPIANPPENMIVSTGFAVVRPLEKFHSGYAGYLLQSNGFVGDVVANSVGVSYPAINASDLVRIAAVEPPFEEQQAIARFLDFKTAQIDALITKQQNLLAKLAEKRTVLISQAVTKGLDPSVPMKNSGVEWLGEIPAHWSAKRIKHLTPVKRGASPRPIDDPKYFDDEGEFAWVRIADVSASDRFLEKTTQRLSEIGDQLSVKMYPGALFLSIAGTVGKPIITKIKCCIHDGFVYFPSLKESSEFLYYIFSSGQPYLGLGKMGTQLNLNTDTVGSIKIGVPPRDEQKAIVVYLDKVTAKLDEQVGMVNRVIERLGEYRSAIITNAVTGKIDVRNFSIPHPAAGKTS